MNNNQNDDAFIELLKGYSKCPYDYPTDLRKDPDPFGYFEAIIGRDGIVYDAPNGHTRGLVMIIAREQNKTDHEVERMADKTHYQEWLLEESGAILVWYDFHIGSPNNKQINTLQQLKEKGFINKKSKRVQG